MHCITDPCACVCLYSIIKFLHQYQVGSATVQCTAAVDVCICQIKIKSNQDHYIVLVTSMKRDRTSAPAACLFLMPFSSEARQNMTELFHKQPAGTGNTTYWQSGSVCMSLRLFPGHCEQITFIHSDRSWSNLRTQSSLYFWFKQILHTS